MLLRDEEPIVRGHAADAISDMGIFLGWTFPNDEPGSRQGPGGANGPD